ncbi:MAG: type II secretion system protein N, partial [Granulosicoccaceae bacterium]
MKAKQIVGGIALFFGVLLVTLVVRTPLASLQSRMPIMLQDTETFQGSLLNGQVKNLGTVNGPVDLKWQLDVLKLFTAKLGGDVEFDWLQATGNGQLAVALDKTVHLSDTIATSPASLIETFLPFVRFGGKLRLELDEGSASQDAYGPFSGELTWQQASVTVSEQASLGDITLTLTEQEGNTHGDLSSTGGDVGIKGNITLSPSGDYSVDLSARAEASASRMVRNTLAQIAEQQSDGSYRIKQSG